VYIVQKPFPDYSFVRKPEKKGWSPVSVKTIYLSICVLLFCVFLTGTTTVTAGEDTTGGNSQQPSKFVPNQILVKFRSQTAKNQAQGQTDTAVKQSLDRLNQKFRVRKTEKVFGEFAKQQRKMEGLRKKAPGRLTKQEKRLLQRSQRAPAGMAVPALDKIYLVELEDGQDTETALKAYQQDPAVEYAELNYLVQAHRSPSDTYFSIQWPLENTGQMYPESGNHNDPPGTVDADMDAAGAWDIFTGSPDVVVAVIDTGVDYNHRDIDGNMWVNEAELNGTTGVDDDLNGYVDDIYGYDFHNHDGNPMDDNGHGTHCAGVIAAEGDNSQDIAGICWQTRIMALKFLDLNGRGITSNAVKSFFYAVANGAEVCSNSWGGGAYSQTLEEAVNYAASQGVILVASAGNDNTDNPAYPAYYSSMIAVAATDSNDDKATFSNYGDWVDVAAPGVDVLSLRSSLAGSYFGTPYDNYTVVLSGTSMACPQAAGVCALLIGANPTLTRDEVTDILMTTGDPIEEGICSSNSRLNVRNMLQHAVPALGRIQFTEDEYSCSDLIRVILADSDLAGQGSHSVSIGTTGGDTENLNLTERASGIGVYDGSIVTESGTVVSPDGLLQIMDGQTITVVYNDANDGVGNSAISEDTAQTDCAGPVVSNVQAAQIGTFWARLSLETDEPSRVRVHYGTDCNDLEGTSQDMLLSLSHNVYLYNLSGQTTYYFDVVATDEFGNETTEDNGGLCYRFTTLAQVSGLHVPIEYPTIQAAIDAAFSGDTVWVADGVYQGDGNRDLDFGGKAITVQSEYGPAYCIIDSQGSVENPHCGFYFHSGEDANSVLDGFTISGGHAEYIEYIGGGIVCENSNPTITHCILANNVGVFGGGMKNTNSSPAVTNCQFIGNAAHLFGGAMDNYNNSHPIVTDCNFIDNLTDAFYSDEWGGGAVGNDENSNPTFSNCRFQGNFTYGLGAGMYNEGNCSPVLKNCIFINNDADWGGGGLASDYTDCHPYVVNCRFINNTADQGGGIYCGSTNTLTVVNCLFDNNHVTNTGGGIWIYNSTMQVVNSTFYHNEALSWGGGIHIQSSVGGSVSNCIFLRNRDFDGYALNAQVYGWADIGLFYNCIEKWVPVAGTNGGNTGDDPRFLDPDGDDEVIGTADDNLRPGPGSPCLDAGNTNRVPYDSADLDNDNDFMERIPLDLDGKARFVDDPNTPNTGLPGTDPCMPPLPFVVDIGAYEGPYQGFRVEPQQIVVPEGSTSSFTVSLSLNPVETITVTVAYHSGDTDISVQSGSVLFFDSSNYNQPQTVVLAAAQDEDFTNGTTWIVIKAQGIASKKIAVREADTEPVPAVVYVDAAATGSQNGLNWINAFTDLQTTLKHAIERPGITEIRVAQGTYHPADQSGNRYESFMLIEGVVWRGGYAGVRNVNPDVRDISLYPTILSGDLNEDDEEGFLKYQDNSYHVVTGKDLSSNTILDGFVIEAGNANGGNVHANGGGMLNFDGSNPVIMDCQFRLNLAHGNGSGMYNENSSPHVIRCRFTGNSMGGNSGAGMYNQDSSPVVEDCDFVGNIAGVGGGMANSSSGNALLINCLFQDNQASFGGGLYTTDDCNPTVMDCTFDNNHADYTGGGLELRDGNPTFARCLIINNTAGKYDWGGAGIDMYQGTALFESCTITGNTSNKNGGGMFVWNGFANMYNCTFGDNTAADLGGGIYLFSHLTGSATLKNCILWNPDEVDIEGKTITVQYSDIEGGYAGTGNQNQDPRFVDAAGGDYHLRWDSPCMDSGDPAYIPQASQQDIDGEPRIMRGGRVDMGSDEVGLKQADFTRNGIVNIADLSIFLNSWLAVEEDANWTVLCDLFMDQRIDMQDFSLFAQDWLWQADWYEE
jgi:hypothetical protein